MPPCSHFDDPTTCKFCAMPPLEGVRVHLVVYNDCARLFIDRQLPNGGGKSYRVREVARRGPGAPGRLDALRAEAEGLADVLGAVLDDEGRRWKAAT